MKQPKLTKAGKLPRIGEYPNYAFMEQDIQKLFIERLPTHTLHEVCLYIAGYFYRQQRHNYERIKLLEAHPGKWQEMNSAPIEEDILIAFRKKTHRGQSFVWKFYVGQWDGKAISGTHSYALPFRYDLRWARLPEPPRD